MAQLTLPSPILFYIAQTRIHIYNYVNTQAHALLRRFSWSLTVQSYLEHPHVECGVSLATGSLHVSLVLNIRDMGGVSRGHAAIVSSLRRPTKVVIPSPWFTCIPHVVVVRVSVVVVHVELCLLSGVE